MTAGADVLPQTQWSSHSIIRILPCGEWYENTGYRDLDFSFCPFTGNFCVSFGGSSLNILHKFTICVNSFWRKGQSLNINKKLSHEKQWAVRLTETTCVVSNISSCHQRTWKPSKPDFGASSLAVLLYSYLLSNKNCRPLNQEFIFITEDTGLCLPASL